MNKTEVAIEVAKTMNIAESLKLNALELYKYLNELDKTTQANTFLKVSAAIFCADKVYFELQAIVDVLEE